MERAPRALLWMPLQQSYGVRPHLLSPGMSRLRYVPRIAATVVALTAACVTPPGAHTTAQSIGAVVTTGQESDAQTIIAIRDTLNRALRDRDVAPLARYWSPDVHITGGNGSLRMSRDSSTRAYAKFFADSTFVAGMRTPERIDVASDDVRRAAEAGRWVWRTRNERGVTEAQGRYLVFWQRIECDWRVRSELYVRTACISGPGCQRAGGTDQRSAVRPNER